MLLRTITCCCWMPSRTKIVSATSTTQKHSLSFWLACRSDIVVMRKGAVMAVSSPKVTQVAISEKLDAQELGGWDMHTSVTGLADLAVESEEEMLDAIRRYLSYLPAHHNEMPPRAAVPAGSGEDAD